jgi:hypothetical protein
MHSVSRYTIYLLYLLTESPVGNTRVKYVEIFKFFSCEGLEIYWFPIWRAPLTVQIKVKNMIRSY